MLHRFLDLHACLQIKVQSAKCKLSIVFKFYHVCALPQEEEIPELEIDIDELLELTDEEQRTRLHVSSQLFFINFKNLLTTILLVIC